MGRRAGISACPAMLAFLLVCVVDAYTRPISGT
jgi:hypothetical protein